MANFSKYGSSSGEKIGIAKLTISKLLSIHIVIQLSQHILLREFRFIQESKTRHLTRVLKMSNFGRNYAGILPIKIEEQVTNRMDVPMKLYMLVCGIMFRD